MIKLKSLFRRGQGGPSGSSKHNAASRSKSQSTTSITTELENEQQQHQFKGSTDNYYPNSSERAVDVGDDYMPLTGGGVGTGNQQTNTLPKQKGVASGKKGHKQPKQIPNNNNANLHDVMSTADALGQTNQYPSLSASSTTSTSLGYVAASTHQQQQQQQQHNKFVHNEQFHEINNKMQDLQNQLEFVSKEKLLLESRVAELLPYQIEVNKLRSEIVKMQSMQEKNQLEIANLKYENESLRSHLHDVVNSPLSDTEKHQIIQDSQRLHSSAPASIALPSLTDAGDIGGSSINNNSTTTPCITPDWDKHSSSSEVSVACLQDKIIQMEETHYSTNEELQATLQELADLQSQLSDAHSENERLAEEKDVLFQSLCRQTEKLNEARQQVTTLQELLLRDTKQAEISTSEREQKLLDLIKTAQQEREEILIKQEELNTELHELRQFVETTKQENTRFRERISLLDSTLDASTAERKQMELQLELQLQQAKEEISQRSIEATRLTTLLENARSKVDELEQELARGEKSDISDLLDAARKEKDTLEEQAAELQDQYSRSQAELRRLKEQFSALTEECKVIKNNAKCAVSHLEYRLDQLQQEKDKLGGDNQQLVDSIAELQLQCKNHLEDKKQLQNLLSKTQNHLADFERKLNDTKEQLDNERMLRKQEADEWQQFQSDLLMTVRVANDFKTEALSEREQLVLDNKTQKEKIRLLEQQVEKLNKQQVKNNETQQSVMSTVQQEMASRRNNKTNNVSSNFSRQDSRLSVKTLVESIESNKQHLAKSDVESENSNLNPTPISPTTTTTTGTTTGGHTEYSNNIPQITSTGNFNSTTTTTKNNDWNENVRLSGSIMSNSTNTMTTTPSATTLTTNTYNSKGPLREQQQQQQSQLTVSNLHINNLTCANLSKSPLSGERKDPLNMLAKNGGSKRNALLKWCQNKTVGYRNIDITNFSSSWNDGLAFCAILHSYLPDRIPYDTLGPTNKRRNFSLAFAAAESVGIPTTLNINDMCQIERPDWTQVMTYVTSIYKHFET